MFESGELLGLKSSGINSAIFSRLLNASLGTELFTIAIMTIKVTNLNKMESLRISLLLSVKS